MATTIAMVMAAVYPRRNFGTRRVSWSAMRLAILVLALLALALAPASALAATTGPARDLAPSAATVTGSADPGEQHHFEYGTSTAYGLSTPTAAAGADGAVQASLTALTPNTTYHYRLVATSGSGGDRTFTTVGPPGAGTSTPTSVGTSSARLRGSVDPNGLATSFHFEYGTTTAYGAHTPEAAVPTGTSSRSVSQTVAGLGAFTAYHFRLVATNAAGVTRGADRVFTTARNVRLGSVSASPEPVLWGGTVTLSGRVTGAGSGGAALALERQDFPFTTPARLVGTTRASSSGRYAFKVGPLWAIARLRVTVGSAHQLVEVRNRLRVGLRTERLADRRIRLQGAVSPAVPQARALLQKRSPRGRWVTVLRAGVSPLRGNRSRYRFAVRRPGVYRVVVLPRDAFAHLRGTSRERRIRG